MVRAMKGQTLDESKELRKENGIVLRYFQMQVIKIQPKISQTK
jgi:hypothetical protein